MPEMDQHKKLGRGIEDFSHLFLSPDAESQESPIWASRNKTEQLEEVAKTTRVICVTSHGSVKERVFLILNLALELTTSGKKVLIFDADFSSPRVCMLVNFPENGSVLNIISKNGTGEKIREIFPGLKLVTLDVDVSDLSALGIKRRLQLKRHLKKAESESDFVIVNVSPFFNSSLVCEIIKSTPEFLILTPHQVNGMINTYSLIKKIFLLNDKASLGLVTIYPDQPEKTEFVFGKMKNAAMKFLGKSIHNLGWLPDDPGIFRSINRQEPLVLNSDPSLATESIRNISNTILSTFMELKAVNTPDDNITGITERLFGEHFDNTF